MLKAHCFYIEYRKYTCILDKVDLAILLKKSRVLTFGFHIEIQKNSMH